MIIEPLQKRIVRPVAKARINVLIDPESLLIDTANGLRHSLGATLTMLGLPLPAEGLMHYVKMCKPFPEMIAALLGKEDRVTIAEFFANFVAHFHDQGRYRGHLRTGGMPLLASLAADGRHDLHYLSHLGGEASSKLLDAYGLQQHMRSVITTEMPGCPGMRLQLLRQTIEQPGIDRSTWMLVSDHPWELGAARQLGIRAVAIGYSRTPIPVLVGCPAEFVAGSIGEIQAHLLDEARHENVVRLIPRSHRMH